MKAFTRFGECFNERPQKAKIFPHPDPSLLPYRPLHFIPFFHKDPTGFEPGTF
jgi:hypothetical protein